MEREAATGPLAGVRVLDLTDPLAAYGCRLLGDLGADVLRIERPDGRGDCAEPPYRVTGTGPAVSLFERFVNAGKRSVGLDLGRPETAPVVGALLASADVVVESSAERLAAAGWPDERVREVNPRLVRVMVTPFGREHLAEDAAGPVDDLVLLGAGGLLHLGGYPDVGPVAVYGRQSSYVSSIFAAVAAVAGLIGRLRTGEPVGADVSGQECVAQALEESVVGYALTGEIRAAQGDVAKEAGTGVYRCADGHVSMVAGRLGTARAWRSLVQWLTELDPAAAELAEERWGDFSFRRGAEAVDRFREIFERVAAGLTRQELYLGAQARGIALSPVNDLGSVLADVQLASRDFFGKVDDPLTDEVLIYPGPPYRLSATPAAAPRPAPVPGADTVAVLREHGLSAQDVETLLGRGAI